MKKFTILLLLLSISLADVDIYEATPYDEIPEYILDRDSNKMKYREEIGSKELDFEYAQITDEEYFEQIEGVEHDDADRAEFVVSLKGNMEAVRCYLKRRCSANTLTM